MKDTAKNAFSRAMKSTNPQPEIEMPQKIIRTTFDLDNETDMIFGKLRLDIRREVGSSVAKVDIIRALILLAADDPTLRNQIIIDLKRAGQ